MSCQHAPVLAKRRFGPFESYVNQCLKCGRRVGRKIPYHQLSQHQIKSARLWNAKLRGKGRGTARTRRYQSYMASPEWRKLRRTILARDGYKCQICGEEASQAHHLNYQRFGHELETDLIAVCHDCNQAERQKSVFHRMMGTTNR